MATLRPIDLRTDAEREGITPQAQTVQSIVNIMKTVGMAEQKRQERHTLDKIATAIANGASSIEAIAAVAKEKPEFSGGIPGVAQRFGNLFRPSPGAIGSEINQAVLGDSLMRALSRLTPEEQTEAARIKAGLYDTTVSSPTKQQSQRDRDLNALKSGKLSDFQLNEVRNRLDADSTLPRRPLPKGQDYKAALDELDDEVKEDGLYGKRAYDELLQMSEDNARINGFEPKDVKADLDRWWDARVNKEQGPGLKGSFTINTLVPRRKFKSTTGARLKIEKDLSTMTDEELQRIYEGLE